MSLENRDEAVREVKLFVRRIVRNDWAFDSTLYADGNRPGPSTSTTLTDGTLCEGRQVVEWRCREFDSAGSELEPQSSDQSDSDVQSPARDQGIERRRRHRRRMDNEMAWNEGLRMWMARRDEWTGARTQRQLRAKDRKRKLDTSQRQTQPIESSGEGTETGVEGSSLNVALNPREANDHGSLVNKTETNLSISDKNGAEAQQAHRQPEKEHPSAQDEEAKSCKEPTATSVTEPEQAPGETPRLNGAQVDFQDSGNEQDSDQEEELDEPLVPVAPPFIPSSNPVRATITPTIYPSIYSKVVVQGLTPTVPINLADLTKAMVQGWKSDGQWPPKPAVSSIVLQDDASVPKKVPDSSAGAAPTRRKNSITNAMRKVFHMGTHPFHRRGSTGQDSGAGNHNANGAAI